MSEIVYYDANATVRALMMQQLANYGLKVVELPSLEQCETVLSRCIHPVIFIVDMSRQPDMLPKLQSVVPKYIRDPERCILTSVTPTALARYLPQKIDDCFFKHVVERPFKRLDFVQFFENVAHPYLTGSESREPTRSSMNSSVSQITGQFLQQGFDAGLAHQVDGIVQSTSRTIALQQLKEDAGERNTIAPVRRENRISKSGRSRAFAGIPENKLNKQTVQLSQEDDRKIRENLNAWRNASANRPGDNNRGNMTAIHKSRIDKCVTPNDSAQTKSLQVPDQYAAEVPQKAGLSPEMEVFENSRTRPTQIPPNVAMRHPDLETIYPDLQPDSETNTTSDGFLDSRLDDRQTMPTQAPSFGKTPASSGKQPSQHPRAVAPHLGSCRPRTSQSDEFSPNSSVPVKATILSNMSHHRATVPGKDRHKPTVTPESSKDFAHQKSSGPTENRAQIIGHLPNFSHTPHTGRSGRAQKPEMARSVSSTASAASANHKAKLDAVKTVESPKAEMVEMSSFAASTSSAPARQHAPAARRARSQSLGNLSSIIKSELKLSDKAEPPVPTESQAQDEQLSIQEKNTGHLNHSYLKRRAAVRPKTAPKLDSDEGASMTQESDNAGSIDEDSLKSNTNHILAAIEDGSRAIGEDENTLIVSPVLLNDIEPMPEIQSPSLIQKPALQSLTPILQTRMSLTFMLQVLKRSMLEEGRMTLSCREGAKTHVAILEAGRMLWFETVVAGRVASVESYFKELPASLDVPMDALLALVQQKMTIPQAFSKLDMDVTAIELCEKQLTSHIQNLHQLYDKPADIHRDVPLPWQPLLTQRPCQSLPASSILFEEFRKYADAMPLPRNFHYMSFAMRPYRTPLNVAIELTAEENELLTAMKQPISILELQKAGKSQCLTMLYRLVMFEFADCVN